MKRLLATVIGSVLLTFSAAAFACSGGQLWERDSGLYTVEVTNDTLLIQPGMKVHFDFAIFNRGNPDFQPYEYVPFSEVTAVFRHGEDIIFQKTIPYSKDRELVGLDLEFPKKNAKYQLNVQFMKDGSQIAQGEVPVTVGTGEWEMKPSSVGWGVGGACLVACVIAGVVRLRRSSKVS